jgi:hypothetical protein
MHNLPAHLQSRRGLSWISDVLPGLAIFIVPFFSFLSPSNLKQLPNNHLLLKIFVSLLFIFLVLFVLYYVVSIVVSKLWNKEIKNLFMLFCFGFYLQFFYLPIRLYLDSYKWHMSLVILLTIWLATIYAACKFDRVVKRLILVFAILMLANSIIPMVGYIYNGYLHERPVDQQMTVQVDKSENLNSSNHNIYYIILDGMIPVEEAKRAGILDKRPVISQIEDLGLRNIEKSLSSYNITYLTLYSIFALDYFATEDTERYANRFSYFPHGVYGKDATQVALLSYLEQAGSSLYWAGNNWADCRDNLASWTCIRNNEYRKALSGLSNFYHTTPIAPIIRGIEHADNNAMGRFLDQVESFGLPKTPFFVLIHHFSPHPPYKFKETCEELSVDQIDTRKGYRDNYHCALTMVDKFMKKINILDPGAIVVFQGDHGFCLEACEDQYQFDVPETVIARGRIFNAIKAPNSCFEKYGEPKTTVNTMRFVLNCAYGFEFPFRKDSHYIGFDEHTPETFGKVFERKVY